MAESPKNISIAVYEQNKEKIKNADNSSEEFIIQMNEFLQIIKGKKPKFTFEDEKIVLETMFESEISSEKGIKRNIS